MKEFMTRVSDYLEERRNNPEKNGNFMIFGMLGVVAIIIIILCLLLLWRRNMDRQEKENEQAKKMSVETFAYVPEIRLSQASDDELKQEYLDNIQYMKEKVKELLDSMMKVKETLEETVIAQQSDNAFLQKQVDEIAGDVNNLVLQLENTQNQLYDLTDLVNVMNQKTIPMIQEQITQIEQQMSKVNADISNIYEKLAMLETTDEELRAKLNEVEKKLKESSEQNMIDITNKFDHIDIRLQKIEMEIQERINELASSMLRYRYDAETNTLYLSPNQ
ncbi:MAG: hypothetical protein K2P65_09695 [Lachnospiraceae bacterium]|nr:hypothetical protein [Lachnospiraceae bacterium]